MSPKAAPGTLTLRLMSGETLSLMSRRDVVRAAILVAALVAGALWVSFQLLQPAPPRRIVMASGFDGGLYHKYAQRYRALLAREGVTVEERMTSGSADNLALLLDSKSGVDVALMQGGVATPQQAESLVMVASLYYEPLWVFHRSGERWDRLSRLKGKRVAIGLPGSGTRAFIEPLLAASGVDAANATLVPLGTVDGLAALRAGEIDAAVMVGGAQTESILAALRDPTLDLVDFQHADAYQRRFPHVTRLTLPAGTIDLGRDLPPHDITLIGTRSMLVAREDLHPVLVNMLVDAARAVHAGQGYFEAPGEFPNASPVDLPVSVDADRHLRFGSRLLYRYLPFWVAAFVERMIVVVVPLLVVLVPVINFLPQFLRWRARSRIYRWYGELALLERDVATRSGELPIERWLTDLDRIRRAVEHIETPRAFASEAYTLREHIALVRRSVLERAGSATATPG